jgi:hypothetical protein
VLQAATRSGHDQVVQWLLEKGADVNARSGDSCSALLLASSGGHDQIVQRLLKEGADVNPQGGYYGSAIQAAVGEGHDQIVQWLLGKGADVNTQGGHYGSALQAAVVKGHGQVVERLLERGAAKGRLMLMLRADPTTMLCRRLKLMAMNKSSSCRNRTNGVLRHYLINCFFGRALAYLWPVLKTSTIQPEISFKNESDCKKLKIRLRLKNGHEPQAALFKTKKQQGIPTKAVTQSRIGFGKEASLKNTLNQET